MTATPASEPTGELPDASTKLRLVLDYLPCEACLAQPVKDQDVLCSVCHRLERQVGVRVSFRTRVLVERPAVAEALIPPAPTIPSPGPASPLVTTEPLFEAPEPVAEAPPEPLIVTEPYEESEAVPEPVGPLFVTEPYEEPEPVAMADIPSPVVSTTFQDDLPVAPEVPRVSTETMAEPDLPAPQPPALAVEPSPPEAGPAEPEPPRRRFFGGILKREKAREAPPPPPEDEEEAPVFEDVAGFEPGSFADDFSYTPAEDPFDAVAVTSPEPSLREAPRAGEEWAPSRETTVETPLVEDDFVFRPPDRMETERPWQAPRAEESPEEDWLAAEEVPVEPETPAPSPWAPPPVPPGTGEAEAGAEEILEMEILEDDEPRADAGEARFAPLPDTLAPLEDEEPILETEIVEMEILKDETAPPASEQTPLAVDSTAARSDLHRLRGFEVPHESALAAAGISRVVHLSGHDAGELAARTGLDAHRLAPWIQVADLVHEVGVPLDAAVSLVHAGIQGPRGLREMDAEDILERVAAFGGMPVGLHEVKRWKRRA